MLLEDIGILFEYLLHGLFQFVDGAKMGGICAQAEGDNVDSFDH